MNVLDFKVKKDAREKISMITCYDHPSAKIIEKTPIDCILVGDSVSMVVHGHDTTTMATMAMMEMHTQAVCRGVKTKFVIADLPFLSYRKSMEETMNNVGRLIQAGANAVKLEGCEGNLKTIEHIAHSGVPVMGHLGLTPQMVHGLGGHKVQGRDDTIAKTITREAKALELAGCFAVVLECIPAALAKHISKQLRIPTIGIGAGPDTDGQVLVFHDMLGFQQDFKPKFLKSYLNTEALFRAAIEQYAKEVSQGVYPRLEEHCY